MLGIFEDSAESYKIGLDNREQNEKEKIANNTDTDLIEGEIIGEEGAEERKKAFIEDIIKVYEKHNLSIAHEDCHGAFIIEELDQWNIDWLKDSLR